jgi:hypothetical protein
MHPAGLGALALSIGIEHRTRPYLRTVITLAIALATSANLEEAIAAIKARLALSGFPGGAE